MRTNFVGHRALAVAMTLVGRSVRSAGQTPVPSRYIGDRFFATPVTTHGDTLLLLVDTGGGGVWMIKPALERVGINPTFVSVVQGDSAFTGGKFPTFAPNASLPIPLGVPDTTITGFGTEKTQRAMGGAMGILGHTWLAGRVWVFDYPAHQMAFYKKAPAPRPFGAHTIPMTLKRPLVRNDPRIRIAVDGDTVDALLDTGGTSDLSPEAIDVMGGGPSLRASAFAAARLWDKWHAKHPTWRVIPCGEMTTDADLIEVPKVSIGGYEVGPVWFAKRPNAAYDDMMTAMMDQPILAAIGGSALKDFRITMDYPHQRATFEKREALARTTDAHTPPQMARRTVAALPRNWTAPRQCRGGVLARTS